MQKDILEGSLVCPGGYHEWQKNTGAGTITPPDEDNSYYKF